jgi:hypothetical protein
VSGDRGSPDQLTSGHLWQLDIVRLLSFGAVIAVHSIGFTQQPSKQVAAGAMMLLQFGRETFFAIGRLAGRAGGHRGSRRLVRPGGRHRPRRQQVQLGVLLAKRGTAPEPSAG